MKLFGHTRRPKGDEGNRQDVDLQERFKRFHALLDKNAAVLKTITDMEVKAIEEYLFDMPFITGSLDAIDSLVRGIIDDMTALGGDDYAILYDQHRRIRALIYRELPGGNTIPQDDFVIPLRGLNRDRAPSVGSKSAHLGELKTRLNMPVPGGFAITAWAYKYFLDSADLQSQISRALENFNARNLEELERVSHTIRNLILAAPVPSELTEAIFDAVDDLTDCKGSQHFSLRSSAVGEDTLFSFAGQYATYLNIRKVELVECYRRIIASKFTPKAIYYFLSHGLVESELAMSVCCLEMIDACASGVVYTHNPIDPNDDSLQVNSIYGLGKFLVDGRIAPDQYQLSRSDGQVLRQIIRKQSTYLVCLPGGGVMEKPIPPAQRELSSLNPDQLHRLAGLSLRIEEHYGIPQDIEWALDRDGDFVILQTRPLRVVGGEETQREDLMNMPLLLRGGETISPGIASGQIHHLQSPQKFDSVPSGAILTVTHPHPGLVTLMERINGLLVEAGGVAGHMATLAREYGLPAMAGVRGIADIPNGTMVTLDASLLKVLSGAAVLPARPKHCAAPIFDDMVIIQKLRAILTHIAPLTLTDPRDVNFKAENCQTLHDITRFCHQKSMQAMFEAASSAKLHLRRASRLKTNIALQVLLLFIDQHAGDYPPQISDDKVPSKPFTAFWSGVKKEGWPSQPPPKNSRGLFAAIASQSAAQSSRFEESSYAVIGGDYLLVSLKLGYHFSTIEAMAAEDNGRNYIRLQHKGGGASLERRIHRVRLLTTILTALGFENNSEADFLDARLDYLPRDAALQILHKLGQLTMKTKQLDMALSNEAITTWYAGDIMKSLDIPHTGSGER